MRSSAPSEVEHGERRRPHLYGRRKGPKLSAHQAALFETLLPELALEIRAGADPRSYFALPHRGEVETPSISGGGTVHPSALSPHPKKPSDFSTSPPGGGTLRVEDIWLEIGFGAGEHLLWQAEHHPRVGLIGAEPYEAGVAKLLSRISLSPSGGEGRVEGASTQTSAVEDTSRPLHPSPLPPWGRGNIKIHMGDAREIIDALPDAALGRVFILFPDPWPKARHHKRRFIQSETLDALARVMKPRAELRFASDDAPYLDWTLERLMAHPAFEWTACSAQDWKSRPPDWPPTRYEQKALKAGRQPGYFRYRRR